MSTLTVEERALVQAVLEVYRRLRGRGRIEVRMEPNHSPGVWVIHKVEEIPPRRIRIGELAE